jgi:hypothetical protein
MDAMHIDSAYKSGCDCMITSDFGDIASKRDLIYDLVGLRVFHFHQHWDDFIEFITTSSD